MSDSESDVEEELQGEQEVELGFVVARADESEHAHALRLHADGAWSRWDGGKVGGRPRWLVPQPQPPALPCGACGAPLALLLQIYCPLDDESDAFHRSLYVFVCREPQCARMGDGRVLRAQLPRENAFYSPEGGEGAAKRVEEDERQSCALCGQSAEFTCAKCHVARYCSKSHQRDHWTAGGHKADCDKCAETGELVQSEAVQEQLRIGGSAWLFPEYALEIDHEPDASEAVDDHEAKLIAEFEKNKAKPKPSAGESDPFSDDSAIDVTQNELNEAIGASGQDKQYVKFLTRVALAKDQVLRYARWQEDSVLWVHESGTRESDTAPPCERCGSARKFEFQVLPQLLFYLKVDQTSSLSEIKKRSVDWGTLAVYTCERSCPLDAQYADEFLHYQPAYAGN